MKIRQNTITSLAGNGYMTLQVPQYDIRFQGDPELPAEIDVPDEWFMNVNYGRLAVGRENGFTFLSPLGFEANREELRRVWEALPDGRRRSARAEGGRSDANDWDAFIAEAKRFFLSVEENTQKEELKARKRANELMEANGRLRSQVREVSREDRLRQDEAVR